jgi:hypothetical protein
MTALSHPVLTKSLVSGALSTTGTGSAIDARPIALDLLAILNILVVAGTNPTLLMTITAGPTATGPWTVVGTFTQAVAAGRQVLGVQGVGVAGGYLQAAYTIGGTAGPTFTCSLDVISVNLRDSLSQDVI